jgi:hypothetical protein
MMLACYCANDPYVVRSSDRSIHRNNVHESWRCYRLVIKTARNCCLDSRWRESPFRSARQLFRHDAKRVGCWRATSHKPRAIRHPRSLPTPVPLRATHRRSTPVLLAGRRSSNCLRPFAKPQRRRPHRLVHNRLERVPYRTRRRSRRDEMPTHVNVRRTRCWSSSSSWVCMHEAHAYAFPPFSYAARHGHPITSERRRKRDNARTHAMVTWSPFFAQKIAGRFIPTATDTNRVGLGIVLRDRSPDPRRFLRWPLSP